MSEVESDTEDKPVGGSVSLYNKYRPHSFSDIIGQDIAKRGLQKAISDRTLKHAYLLAGDRGCGKTTTARIIAAAANCEFAKNGDPCTECDNCVATFSGTFSGVVQELNAADNRGIDDVRRLLTTVDLGVAHNKKFIIIDEVHRLTADAASLLLKPIEEPTNDQVVFILATTDPEKMLPTILSRVTRINFTLLSDEHLFQLVEKVCASEGFDLTDDQKRNVVYGGHGSARDTLSELERAVMGFSSSGMEVSASVIQAITTGNYGEILGTINSNSDSMDYVGLLEDVLEFYRNCVTHSASPDLVSDRYKWFELVKSYSESTTQATLIRNIEILSETFAKVGSFGSRRILVEGTFARLISPTGKQKIDVMSEDIASMKRMIQGLTKMVKRQGETISNLSTGVPVPAAPAQSSAPTDTGSATRSVDDSSSKPFDPESSSSKVSDWPEVDGYEEDNAEKSSKDTAEQPDEDDKNDTSDDRSERLEGRRRRRRMRVEQPDDEDAQEERPSRRGSRRSEQSESDEDVTTRRRSRRASDEDDDAPTRSRRRRRSEGVESESESGDSPSRGTRRGSRRSDDEESDSRRRRSREREGDDSDQEATSDTAPDSPREDSAKDEEQDNEQRSSDAVLSDVDIDRIWDNIIDQMDGDRNVSNIKAFDVKLTGTTLRLVSEKRTPTNLQRRLTDLLRNQGVDQEVIFERVG